MTKITFHSLRALFSGHDPFQWPRTLLQWPRASLSYQDHTCPMDKATVLNFIFHFFGGQDHFFVAFITFSMADVIFFNWGRSPFGVAEITFPVAKIMFLVTKITFQWFGSFCSGQYHLFCSWEHFNVAKITFFSGWYYFWVSMITFQWPRSSFNWPRLR